jgi:hypothetical protein
MVFRALHLVAGGVAALCLASCSHNPSEKAPAPVSEKVAVRSSANAAVAPLLHRIWRRSDASYGPAAGSIYIFLQNGTLLETSCLETYRVALWSVDPAAPDTLRVVEDQRQVFTATLREVSENALHLHQTLLHEKDPRDVTLSAVDGEFVCPDLPKR